MYQRNLYPPHRYPPINCLAAAIKRLPPAGPDVPTQIVDINAGPAFGRYSVTFVVRRNLQHAPPRWFWGVESSERTMIGNGS